MTTLDFEYLERQICRQNLFLVKQEVQEQSPKLKKRILHFSSQFGVPENRFWDELKADPTGPLASILELEPRRQNIHEKHAAEFITKMDHVSDFEKLPATGKNALYLNSDGQFVSRGQLGGATKPSKSLDFRWITDGIVCLAAQKYTKEGGGNQDSQFNEMVQLLGNYLRRTNQWCGFRG